LLLLLLELLHFNLNILVFIDILSLNILRRFFWVLLINILLICSSFYLSRPFLILRFLKIRIFIIFIIFILIIIINFVLFIIIIWIIQFFLENLLDKYLLLLRRSDQMKTALITAISIVFLILIIINNLIIISSIIFIWQDFGFWIIGIILYFSIALKWRFYGRNMHVFLRRWISIALQLN
jgi:hypothetical protein